MSFVYYNPYPSLILCAFAFLLATSAGKQVLKSVGRTMLLVLPAITAIMTIQTFFLATLPSRPIRAGPVVLHLGGIYYGAVLDSRILFAVTLTVTLLVTTHPGDLFAALKKIRVPFTAGFMLTTMLQFVPILLTEAGVISQAQRSRGVEQNGVKALLPNMVPLFVIGWQRAQTLAMAYEVRGLGSPVERTSFRRIHAKKIDYVLGIIATIATVLALTYAFQNSFLDWKATYSLSPTVALAIGVIFGAGFFGTVGLALLAYKQF